MKEVKINVNDVKKAIYFITNLTQLQGDRPMTGALTSKADYMGGILDRWINIIPESVLFNRVILPQVFEKEKVEVITDYYDYNPKLAGIAPDVLGIKYKNKVIPFVKFNNGWVPVNNKPQIEVKTYKKNQYMVSLRNQRYENKYLVLAETNFRVDYLVPLLDKALFSNKVFLDLHMDDKVFIISDDEGIIAQPKKVILNDKTLGTVKLLAITTANDFMNVAVKCGSRVSVEYIKSCEEYNGNKLNNCYRGKLLDYCYKSENGLCYFNLLWYDFVDENGFTYKGNKKIKTTGFYVSNPENIEVLKINKNNIYIKALDDCIWQNVNVLKDKIYKISFDILDRSSNNGEEYFMSKPDLHVLNDAFEALASDLKKSIKNE